MSRKPRSLIRFIRKFNKSKDPQVKMETAQYIKFSIITLEDLITVLTHCPAKSEPFVHAKNNLLETIPSRLLKELVKIYESIYLGCADEIKSFALEAILSRDLDNDQWIKVMEAINFRDHELCDITYQKLISNLQERIITFKMHRLTKDGSPERKFLEDCIITPYLSRMSIDELLDITLHCAPNSKLIKEAEKMLHFVST